MNDFLEDPKPERISRLHIRGDGSHGTTVTLTVGLALITETVGGLKVVPHVAPTIAMGIGDGFTEKFDLPVSWARELAHKLLEWCDIAERGK